MNPTEDKHNLDDRIKAALEEFKQGWRKGDRAEPTLFCENYPDLKPHLYDQIGAFLYVAEQFEFGNRASDESETGDIGSEDQNITGMAVGDFRIIREIGRGGMGAVYEAEQVSLHRKVALKVLSPHLKLSIEAVLKFQREAEAGSRQRHQGIVAVYAVGEHDGIHYIAQELVEEGFTIDDRLEKLADEKELPFGYFREVAGTVSTVASALHHAHESGVIHRDIKPSNILLTKDGKPKVTDFGLAKIEDALALSRTGDFAGTPYYMSPEQAMSKRIKIDHRTDIYSLGVTMYEMLTMQRPFDGKTTHEVLKKIIFMDPVEPHKVNPRTPHDLSVICIKAMEKENDRRYQSMKEFEEDLNRFLSGDVILAKPAGPGTKFIKRLKRNPVLSAAVAVAVAALLALLVLTPWYVLNLKQKNKEAGELRSIAEKKAIEEATARKEATDNLSKFNMLANLVKLEEAKADQFALVPPWPEKVAAMQEWIDEQALPIIACRQSLQETLYELRKSALPYTDEERKRDMETHPNALELARKRCSITDVDDLILNLEEGGYSMGKKRREWVEWRAQIVKDVEILTERVKERRWYDFEDRSLKFLHDKLCDLISNIESFEKKQLADVRERLEWAKKIEQWSILDYEEEWISAISCIKASDGISASKLYGELEITPQIGLVPIGMDPESKLWEFVHLRSGTDGLQIPIRDSDTGRLKVTDDTGIVYVLLPGGAFLIGAQKQDRSEPNYDRSANSTESPVIEIRLAPFFMSKYEMTQGQWMRLNHDENPSGYSVGRRFAGGRMINLAHPVEQVNWMMCDLLLLRYGLTLPTEAQWEYACRAGTDTPWWTGKDRDSLRGAVNLADATAAREHVTWPVHDWPDYEDGFVGHAPVDSFLPNPFGLHNVHGNVWEWCRDIFGKYRADEIASGDGYRKCMSLITTSSNWNRIMRGGSFTVAAIMTRSSMRGADPPEFQRANVGVRPARPLY